MRDVYPLDGKSGKSLGLNTVQEAAGSRPTALSGVR